MSKAIRICGLTLEEEHAMVISNAKNTAHNLP